MTVRQKEGDQDRCEDRREEMRKDRQKDTQVTDQTQCMTAKVLNYVSIVCCENDKSQFLEKPFFKLSCKHTT